MRVSVSMLFVFLFSTAGCCLCAGQESGEQTVRAALNPKSTAIYEGFSEGPLNRLGDAAAVAITKVVADKDLNEDDIDRILMIIQKSFAAPKIVETEADRHPRTALFILKYLETLPTGQELKSRIGDTKKFVESVKSTPRRRPTP